MGCIKEADSSDYSATEEIQAEEAQNNQDSDGDPVNMVTGAFTLAEHDFSIPTQRLVIDVTRHYNNQLHDPDDRTPVSGFGRGWSHSLDIHLEPGPRPLEITYVDDRGTRLIFSLKRNHFLVRSKGLTLQESDDGEFIIESAGKLLAKFDSNGELFETDKENEKPNDDNDQTNDAVLSAGPGLLMTSFVKKNGKNVVFNIPYTSCQFTPPTGSLALELISFDQTFSLRQIDGLTAWFNQDGRLIRLSRPGPISDSEINLNYDSCNRLKKVLGSGGRYVEFHYLGDGKLIYRVSDHTKRQWTYKYNEFQELIEVQDPIKRIRRYKYGSWSGMVASGKGKTELRKIRALNKVFPFIYNDRSSNPRPQLVNQYTTDRRVYRQTDALGNVTRFDYNRFTYTTYLTNPLGWTTVYAFNANGNTTKVRKPGGGTKEFIYDDRSNLLAEIDEQENITQYVELKNINRLRKAGEFGRRANGNRSAYVTLSDDDILVGYDESGNRPLIQDSSGNITRYFDYDRFGHPQRVELPDGSSILYVYDQRSGLPTRTERILKIGKEKPIRQVQEWIYDEIGNVIKYEQYVPEMQGSVEQKKTVTIEYDTTGNHPVRRREWIDAGYQLSDDSKVAAKEEHYTWNELGHLITRTDIRYKNSDQDADCLTTHYGYDSVGREIWRINPENTSSCRIYDLDGRVIESFLVANAKPQELLEIAVERKLERKQWRFDLLGQEIEYIDPTGAKTFHEWDAAGRFTKIIEPTGSITRYEYDRDGNQVSLSTAKGYKIQTIYDASGRPIAASDNLGRHSSRTYDPLGHIESITEGSGENTSTTWFYYNWQGHLNKVLYPDGAYEQFMRDEVGNLISVEKGDFESQGLYVERYSYDSLGRPTIFKAGEMGQLHTIFTIKYIDHQRAVQVIDANSNSNVKFYDSLGNIIKKIDGEGNSINMDYDSGNRLVRRWSNEGSVSSFYHYNARGNLIQAEEDPILYRWDYDVSGKLIKHEQQIGAQKVILSYEYDNVGRMVSKLVDNSWWMRFHYLPDSLYLSKIEMPGQYVTFSSDCAGKVINETWNDGGSTNFLYDFDGSLAGLESYDKNQKCVFAQHLKKDSRGRPKSEYRITPKQEEYLDYFYDPLNRLVGIDKTQSGKRVSSIKYTFDGINNRLEEYLDQTKLISYSYDEANRLIESRDHTGNIIKYAFDKNGNLVKRGEDRFTYDAAQRLRKVSLNSETDKEIQYHYSALDSLGIASYPQTKEAEIIIYDVIHQIITEDSQKKYRFFWGNQIDSLLAANFGDSPSRAYKDCLGSILSFDPSNHWYEYGAYGEVLEPFNSSFTLGYSGKRYESESRLYYSRMRFYDPLVGRFTQPDPWGIVDGANLYQYAKGNPLVYADPLGLASCQVSSEKESHGSLGVWPSTPEAMDRILGFTGQRIADLPFTPGRDKVVWNLPNQTEIVFEKHPYHQNAPAFHTGPHWHVTGQGMDHTRFLPGELMPNLGGFP